MLGDQEEHMKLEFRRLLLWMALLVVYWSLSCAILWWSYDVGPLINGGYFSRERAVLRVFEMGLIVTALTAVAWVWADRAIRNRKWVRLWWGAAWKTLTVLLVYFLAVLVRREMWAPSQGTNDSAMFLPIVGPVNSVFFAEFRWLSFLVNIIPSMGLISGLLFCIYRCWATNRSSDSKTQVPA
jgi:hypothetical protein